MGKLTYQEVKDFIEGSEGNGCKLLSTDYVNSKVKLKIRCACGEIFETRFNNFKSQNKRQCDKCSGQVKWNFESVKDFIEGSEGNGCKLLSTEFINRLSKLQIRCACGEIFETNLQEFTHGKKRQCNKCGSENARRKKSVERYIIKCSYCGEDLPPMTKYQINTCKHHFCKNKKCHSNWCKEHNKGKSNPNYDLNMSDEERLVRKEKRRHIPNYDDFIEKVLKRDDYTCQCCKKRGGDMVVHHLNSYNSDKEHRTDELNGITLCKGCHSELHSIYGYGNNTIEQFREFLYNKYLQTKDLKYLATLEDIDIRKHIMLTNNLSLPI